MKLKSNRFAAAAAFAAAVSLAAPAQADGRWGGRHHRDHDVDAGDVVAGVLVLGAIAAIFGSSSRKAEPRAEPPYQPPPEDPAPAYTRDSARPNGLDYAADQCTAEIERGPHRVAAVDSVARNTGGWQVWGEVDSGAPFACRVDNDGRVANVEIGDDAPPAQGD